MQLSIKKFSDITAIPLSSAHGFNKTHNQNTLLSMVMRSFSEEELEARYEKVITEENLVVMTKESFEEKLVSAFFKSSDIQIMKFPFDGVSHLYDIGVIKDGKRFAVSFKLYLQKSEKQIELLKDLQRDGVKEFGDFEVVIFTLKSNYALAKEKYMNLNVQFIDDLLKIEDEKLIILPKKRVGGAT